MENYFYELSEDEKQNIDAGSPLLYIVVGFYVMGVYNGYVEQTRLWGE